jgi:hypothetical protein
MIPRRRLPMKWYRAGKETFAFVEGEEIVEIDSP